MDTPKLCIDCKHFTGKRECKHPSNGIDFIDGKAKIEWVTIGAKLRIDEYDGYETLIELSEEEYITA